MSKWLHKKTGNIVEFTDEVFIEQVIIPQGHYEEVIDDAKSKPRGASDGNEADAEGRAGIERKPKRNSKRAKSV